MGSTAVRQEHCCEIGSTDVSWKHCFLEISPEHTGVSLGVARFHVYKLDFRNVCHTTKKVVSGEPHTPFAPLARGVWP